MPEANAPFIVEKILGAALGDKTPYIELIFR